MAKILPGNYYRKTITESEHEVVEMWIQFRFFCIVFGLPIVYFQ